MLTGFITEYRIINVPIAAKSKTFHFQALRADLVLEEALGLFVMKPGSRLENYCDGLPQSVCLYTTPNIREPNTQKVRKDAYLLGQKRSLQIFGCNLLCQAIKRHLNNSETVKEDEK